MIATRPHRPAHHRTEHLRADDVVARAGVSVGMPPGEVQKVVDAVTALAGELAATGCAVIVPWMGELGERAPERTVGLSQLLPLATARTGCSPSTVAVALAAVTVEVERALGRGAVVEVPGLQVWTGPFRRPVPSAASHDLH